MRAHCSGGGGGGKENYNKVCKVSTLFSFPPEAFCEFLSFTKLEAKVSTKKPLKAQSGFLQFHGLD